MTAGDELETGTEALIPDSGSVKSAESSDAGLNGDPVPGQAEEKPDFDTGDNSGKPAGEYAGEMAKRYQDGLAPEKRYSLTDRGRAVMEYFEKQAQGLRVGKEDYPEAFQGPDWDYGGTGTGPAASDVPPAGNGDRSEENTEIIQETIPDGPGSDTPQSRSPAPGEISETPEPEELPDTEALRDYPQELPKAASPVSGNPASEEPEAVTLDKTEDNLGNCPECGSPLCLYRTRRGQMAGCSRYPACRYMKPVAGIYRVRIEQVIPDSACPVCGSPMAVKSGRYGQFVGCTNYPECTYIFREKPERLPCPECLKGNLMLRKTRFQKVFWSCDRYPDCTCRLNKKPVRRHCAYCRSPVMLEFRGRQGVYLRCPLCGKRASREER